MRTFVFRNTLAKSPASVVASGISNSHTSSWRPTSYSLPRNRRCWSILVAPLAVLVLGLPGARPNPAMAAGEAAASDVVIYCDPTLTATMRAVGRSFTAQRKAPVQVFSAPPPLMLAQLAHETQDDVLTTLRSAMDEAVAKGLVKPETSVGAWRNRLVIGRRVREAISAVAADPTSVMKLLGNGRFASPDPSNATTIDGPQIIADAGLQQVLDGHLIGAANTADVAFLLTSGAARLGLLYMTDVRSQPSLAVAATLPDASYAPIVYVAAASSKAKSPNLKPFLDLIRTPEASNILQAGGLEMQR